MSLSSPFQCTNQVVAFPDKIISGRLVVRIDNDDLSAKVLIKIDGTPAEDNADIYLLGGESYEFKGSSVPSADHIKIINVLGNPLIYWLLENL